MCALLKNLCYAEHNGAVYWSEPDLSIWGQRIGNWVPHTKVEKCTPAWSLKICS